MPRRSSHAPQRHSRRYRRPPRRFSPITFVDQPSSVRIGTQNVNGFSATAGREQQDMTEALQDDPQSVYVSPPSFTDLSGTEISFYNPQEGQARYPRRQRQPPCRFSPPAELRSQHQRDTTQDTTMDDPLPALVARRRNSSPTADVQRRPESVDPQPYLVRELMLWVYDEWDGPVQGRHTRVCTIPPMIDEAGNMTHTPVNYLKKVDSDGETVPTQDD